MEHAFCLDPFFGRAIHPSMTSVVAVWDKHMKCNLTLASTNKQTAMLVALIEGHPASQKFLEYYLETPDGVNDKRPLFVIWCRGDNLDAETCVQEYAPFEDGVRQLVKVYE